MSIELLWLFTLRHACAASEKGLITLEESGHFEPGKAEALSMKKLFPPSSLKMVNSVNLVQRGEFGYCTATEKV